MSTEHVVTLPVTVLVMKAILPTTVTCTCPERDAVEVVPIPTHFLIGVELERSATH